MVAQALVQQPIIMVESSHDFGIGGDTVQILPIKELKDTAKISKLCHESGEPIFITKNGYCDMVILSPEAYDQLDRDAEETRIVAAVQAGIEDAKAGRVRDAFEVIDELRAKYGL